MLVKVCGMRDASNIEEIGLLKPDWMGFIFYNKSKRYVAQDSPSLSGIRKVGVFVNEDLENILSVAKQHELDIIQLHGQETVEVCKALRASGFLVVKVFQIGNTINENQMKPYANHVDYFLFDTKTEEYGGSGKHFDWNVLKMYSLKTPFLLSGGITEGDVDRIKNISNPMLVGVDINSQFEDSPGMKNKEMVGKFIEKIRV